MKRTALILAGAAAFDLGVMAVAVQAQQQTQTPRSTGPAPSGPGQDAAGLKAFEDLAVRHETYIKIDPVNTIQACTARRGQVVTHEGAQQCRIPTPDAAAPSIGNPTRRPGGIPPRN